MKFVDLEAQQSTIKNELRRRIDAVLSHGKYIMGPEVQELEERLADMAAVPHAIGCASGTDGLLMALMAFEVGPGDIVLTTPFTFVSTAEVVRLLGARPVFVDIRADTFNIDPACIGSALDALPAEQRERVRGLIAVDLFGLPADYDALRKAVDDHHFIIEDAAQSFGAQYRSKPAGGLADIGVTSFFPAKPLGCYGDGGALFTQSEELAEKLRSIRIHGKGRSKYDNVRIGVNGRLDTLQAAVLLAKLEVFDDEIQRRREIAGRYQRGIGEPVRTPPVPPGYESAWANFTVSTQNRDELQKRLSDNGIPTAVYYPKPLDEQGAFLAAAGRPGGCPVSTRASREVLSLPVHPYLQADDVDHIIAVVNNESNLVAAG